MSSRSGLSNGNQRDLPGSYALDQPSSESAERLTVPATSILSVEHPCIVSDISRAITSLGGESQIRELLLPSDVPLAANVSLRPGDPFARKITSKELSVDNLVLRVLVPKRTGRKRKRGSTDPFVLEMNGVNSSSKPLPLDAPGMLQMLRDNADKYSIEVAGTLGKTHRFRSLPDFQQQARKNPMMIEIGSSLFGGDLKRIKTFDIQASGSNGRPFDIIGPPQFSAYSQSMNYQFLQNPAVALQVNEKGKKVAVNVQKPRKREMYGVSADIETVPQAPPTTLAPIKTAALRQAIKNLAKLLDERPIVTRRVAMNTIDWGSETLFKEATQHVAYHFRSGPWKDALVKYGVDPRQDPTYGKYQTLSFQLLSKDKIMEAAKKMPGGKNRWLRSERPKRDVDTSKTETNHIFDGTSVTTNGKTWQICDIVDPVLKHLIVSAAMRKTCDVHTWGWYHNGTLATLRIIMRDKIATMLAGDDPSANDRVYEQLTAMPQEISASNVKDTYLVDVDRADMEIDTGSTKGKRAADRVVELATVIRTLAKNDAKGTIQEGPGAGKAPREFRDGEVPGAAGAATGAALAGVGASGADSAAAGPVSENSSSPTSGEGGIDGMDGLGQDDELSEEEGVDDDEIDIDAGGEEIE